MGLAVTPSQVVPLICGKFQQLIAHLRDLCSSSISLSSAGVRNDTFFIVDFFTGDRASDLGHLQSCNNLRTSARAASGTVTPVSHPDNFQAAVCCVCSITALAFLFCL